MFYQQRGGGAQGRVSAALLGVDRMVVNQECMECVRVVPAEDAAAGQSGVGKVGAGDDVLVIALLMFAVIALFIFSFRSS